VEQAARGGLRKAVDFFEDAIARDPSYAIAHAGLADSYSVMGFYGFTPPKESWARAKRLAERALALDDGLAEAHVSRGLIHYWFDWDFRAAEAELRRAIAIDPNNVNARMFLGQVLAALGRSDESDPEWSAALEVDPLSPLTQGIVGSGLFFARRYDEGMVRCKRALEIDPDHVQSLFALAMNASWGGDLETAVRAGERAVAVSSRSPFFVASLGIALARSGRRADAEAVARELLARRAHEYILPLLHAWMAIVLGDLPAALDHLERALDERNAMMFALSAMRIYDPLRGDPRFESIQRRVGIAAR